MDEACQERKDVATVHARAGRLDAAVTDFSEALRLWVTSDGTALRSACLQNRGICCQKLQRLDDADRDFTEAVALQPDEPAPYVNRGGVRYLQKRYVQALVDFERYLQLDPDNALQMRDTVGQHIQLCSQPGPAPDDFSGEGQSASDTDDDDAATYCLCCICNAWSMFCHFVDLTAERFESGRGLLGGGAAGTAYFHTTCPRFSPRVPPTSCTLSVFLV
jgi:tetratricopeptide (TPR) repeat protein